jgi:hypothetical protein
MVAIIETIKQRPNLAMCDPTEQQGTTSTLDAVEKACIETTTSNSANVEPSLSSNDHSALPRNEQGDKMTPRVAYCWSQFCNFYEEYEFLLLIVLAIALAKAYPPLGTDYLAPKITATWVAVIFIFGKKCRSTAAAGRKVLEKLVFG